MMILWLVGSVIMLMLVLKDTSASDDTTAMNKDHPQENNSSMIFAKGFVLTQIHTSVPIDRQSNPILGDYDEDYGILLRDNGLDMQKLSIVNALVSNPLKKGFSTQEHFIFDAGAQFSLLSHLVAGNILELGKGGICRVQWGDGSTVDGEFTIAALTWNDVTMNHAFCVLDNQDRSILNSAFLKKWNICYCAQDDSFRPIGDCGTCGV